MPGAGDRADRRDRARARRLARHGVNERRPERPGTLYNTLLYHAPDGELALHHRKLVPTNHERLVWGLGDGGGLARSRRGSAASAG